MTIPRVSLLLVLLPVLGLPASEAPPPPGQPSLRVGLLPDLTGGPPGGLELVQQAVAELNLLDPDLVLTIGDMVQGYTWSPERWRAQWERYRQVLGELRCPWYPTVGNHDIFPGVRTPAGGEPDRTNQRLYEEHCGPLWHTHQVQGVQFIHLCSDVDLTGLPTFGAEQLTWLERELAASQARAIYVLVHKPAWAYGDGSTWEPVHRLLVRGPVRAVLAGHFHAYQQCETRDGIEYYILGALGGHLHKPPLAGGLQHYALLTVRPEGHQLALLQPGAVLPPDHVLRSDYVRVDANGSYGNRDLWVGGSLPEPIHGADGRVEVHLSNQAQEEMELALTLDRSRSGRWRLEHQPIHLTLGPGATTDRQVRLTSPPVPRDQVVAPTLLVHFRLRDSRDRLIDHTRPLRVPLMRRAAPPLIERTGTFPAADLWGRAAPVLCEHWYPDYTEQPGDPRPRGALLLTATTLELHLTWEDADPVAFPEQRPTGAVLSDAVRLHVRDRTLLLIPFASPEPLVWVQEGEAEPRAVSTAIACRLHTSPEDPGCELWLSVPRSLLGIPADSDASAVPCNLEVLDNDGTPYTTTYGWVRPSARGRPSRGTLILR